jgi:hypothetical protein
MADGDMPTYDKNRSHSEKVRNEIQGILGEMAFKWILDKTNTQNEWVGNVSDFKQAGDFTVHGESVDVKTREAHPEWIDLIIQRHNGKTANHYVQVLVDSDFENAYLTGAIRHSEAEEVADEYNHGSRDKIMVPHDELWMPVELSLYSCALKSEAEFESHRAECNVPNKQCA